MNEQTVVALKGRIDSGNAADVEQSILAQLAGTDSAAPVALDAQDLEYTSSAGLRVILRLKKSYPELKIINVNSEVYEILDMTGFTEMMPVEKAYRVVSTEGCEEIGRGANGTIYRIDKDNVVKVYNNADALEDIQHERQVAKLALILGIPTAISYDVVRVGESYGSVFELLKASSFSKILAAEPEKMDWCVKEYIDLLKKIHGTVVPEGKLPDMKETVVGWAEFLRDHLPEEYMDKLLAMIKAIPHTDHMMHGDYHTKNVMLQGDEVLLIDMDTLSVGDPIFDLAFMYNAFIGFSEQDHNIIKEFQGFDHETAEKFWHKSLAAYLGTNCPTKIKEVEDKARIVGYTRLVRHAIRRGGNDPEKARQTVAYRKEKLMELLDRTDTLVFNPNELEIEAADENLEEVLAFIEEKLEAFGCPPKKLMQIRLASEEIFVNIAHYAYAPDKGKAKVRVEVTEDPVTVSITFIDKGVPYDPLAKEDPNIHLDADERQIGGLGIFLVKQTMDDVNYEYKDGQNILTLKKSL